MSDDLFKRLKAALTDRYDVESELDRGGMAVVYLAKDLRHDRKVAIKVLNPDLSATLGTERFLREIDVIAQLQHPNILTLIDSGEVEGLPYYVMPYVKGHSLAALLEKEGRLPLAQALRIASEVAEALETAHQQGVIHRDIKPSNVLLSGGHAVVADFGIAAALDESKLGRLTATGSSMGSPIYMSPEQAGGERELDGRTDIYALGCMVYEMLGGEPPFDGSLESVVSRKVLGEFRPLKEINPDVPAEIEKAVHRALERDADKRFATAGEMREALLAGLPVEGPKGWGRRQKLGMAAVVLVVVAGAVAAVVQNRRASELQVWRAEKLAGIESFVDGHQYAEALVLARELEAAFPGDTGLARLYPELSYVVPINTDPPGARVYLQEFGEVTGDWEFLGETPLQEVRFAGLAQETEAHGLNYIEAASHRLRFELEGYRTRDLLKTAILGVNWRGIPPMDPVVLTPETPELEGMVRLPPLTVEGTLYTEAFLDRFEVTNREFQEFVDAGGYRNPEYWVHPFVHTGEELSFEEAMAELRDQTGQPGPSTWRLGAFPEGQGDYPVGGVSWYEAEAYARWAGKMLPTAGMLNWGRRYYRENSYVIVPRSNLGTDGPRPVGENEAMSTLGVYDLVGNVREWLFNEYEEGQRGTRGAAWTDAPFHVGWVITRPPFDRDETNGFRLMSVAVPDEVLANWQRARSSGTQRDFWAEEPVSDAEFEVIRRMYAYDPYPLNAVVEEADTSEHWIQETVSFDTPYAERGGAFLYLPRRASGPLQAVIFWGGSGIYDTPGDPDPDLPWMDFMIRSGRAVVVPHFKGAYGRAQPPRGRYGHPQSSSAWRDATIEWLKDISATIDYLEGREDVDADKVGYYGFSHGGWMAAIVMAIEPRVKASVTNVGGLPLNVTYPEADPFNFLPRVTSPLLMINGRYDIVNAYGTQQLPMFELVSTPEEDKRHFVAEASHIVPLDEVIREALAWFDKYLGVPGG